MAPETPAVSGLPSPGMKWDRELRQARRALARNRARIEAASSAGTKAGKRSEWKRKPGKRVDG